MIALALAAVLNDHNPHTQPVPTAIHGSMKAGYTVTWSDGGSTYDAGLPALKAECSHDEHPQVCYMAWQVYFKDLHTMKEMLNE